MTAQSESHLERQIAEAFAERADLLGRGSRSRLGVREDRTGRHDVHASAVAKNGRTHNELPVVAVEHETLGRWQARRVVAAAAAVMILALAAVVVANHDGLRDRARVSTNVEGPASAAAIASVPSGLASAVTLQDGSIQFTPPDAADTTAVTNGAAIAALEGFVPADSLVGKPSVFLARFTDTTDAGSSYEGNAVQSQYQLKDRPVVAVMASGPAPPRQAAPLPKGVTPPTGPLPDATLTVILDARTGGVLEFLTSPGPPPAVSTK